MIRTAPEAIEAAAKVAQGYDLLQWEVNHDVSVAAQVASDIAKAIHALAIEIAPVAAGEFVLVPREPTEAMFAAGAQSIADEFRDMSPLDIDRSIAANAYRAMISAALPPPAPESELRRGEFQPGDRVVKIEGYPFGKGDAVVLAAYRCAEGKGPWRYVVEHPEGWQHIFSGKQLALAALNPGGDGK